MHTEKEQGGCQHHLLKNRTEEFLPGSYERLKNDFYVFKTLAGSFRGFPSMLEGDFVFVSDCIRSVVFIQ